MRGRGTGLLLALILLVAAIPAVLDCCLHTHGPDADHAPRAATSAVRVVHDVLGDAATAPVPSTRGCVEHATPEQTPYIEPTSGGGANPSGTRATDTYTHTGDVALAAAPYLPHRTGPADDGTGPPLWLSICVSRT